MNAWPALVFGWPAIGLALALAVLGIARLKPVYAVGGAIVSSPFSFYLIGSPRFWWLGVGIPLLLVTSAIAVRYGRAELAWSALVPVFGIVGWLAIMVIGQ